MSQIGLENVQAPGKNLSKRYQSLATKERTNFAHESELSVTQGKINFQFDHLGSLSEQFRLHRGLPGPPLASFAAVVGVGLRNRRRHDDLSPRPTTD